MSRNVTILAVILILIIVVAWLIILRNKFAATDINPSPAASVESSPSMSPSASATASPSATPQKTATPSSKVK